MNRRKRNVAREIIADLKDIHEMLRAGIDLRTKYTVRTVRQAPDPRMYIPAKVQATRKITKETA